MTQNNRGRWLPGQSGNVNGRPLGSRSEFSASFMRDLARVWAQRGGDVVEQVATADPVRFFSVCSTLIPKDVAVTLQARLPGNLSPDDWQLAVSVLDAVRTALPDANHRPPAEVLSFVLDAIRAHDATIVSTTQVRHTDLIDDKAES